VLLTHPLPSLMYVAATIALSFLAAASRHATVDGFALARVAVAVACAEASIGALNDFRDRDLDAARQDKPIARGWATPREALICAVASGVIAMILFASLGPVAFAIGVPILGLGLAYDLGLKATPLSAILFAVYFPLFPLLAWAVFGHWQPFLIWLVPLGAALGLALNVANALPDLEDDAAAGIRGLPHLLGWRVGRLVAWGTPPLVLGVILLLAATDLVPARPVGLIVAAVGALLPALAAPLLYRLRPIPPTLRICFLLQGAGVIVLGAGWMAAVV
jgi:4-hydroxybenzoate polyprenyltransferase